MSYHDSLINFGKNNFNDEAYLRASETDESDSKKQLTQEEKNTLKRLEFPEKVKITLGARVGFVCSYPNCGQNTIGPKDNSFAILGEAAHIYGAVLPDKNSDNANRIPRPAPPEITEDYIKCLDNGIWLCAYHHKLVDSIWSEKTHTSADLKRWKVEAENKQAKALKEKEHEVIKKFFDKLPEKLCGGKVQVNKFSSAEWALILYVNHFRFYNFDFTMEDYRDWLTSNDINPKEVGVTTNFYDQLCFVNYEKLFNNLVGILYLQEGTDLYKGTYFDALIEDLRKIDKDYQEKILDEMRVTYE